MDYLEIIIQGYCIDNNRKYLHDYFSREFQKAISKGYSAKEFHDGCLLVLNEWEAPMYKSLIERQNMLSLMIDRANNGEADLSVLDKKPISKKGYIKQLETELNTITVQNYPAQLSTLTKHKATGVIYYDGIQYIKDALKKAYKRTLFIYDDFGELFRYAVRYELISGIEVTQVGTESYLLKLNTYNFEFNRWLQEIKGWDYGNEKQYNEYLNKETFKEFLNYKQEQEQQRQNEIEAEKQSWAVETPQQTETKTKQETPKTFEELFYNTDLVDPCIDILKELDPPLIDTDCNYIGKLKGVFCVWIDEMQRQGIVKHYSDRKIFASLIPQKIKRFSIDESMFGKYQSKAENLYRTDIKTKVSKIKLSQDSQ